MTIYGYSIAAFLHPRATPFLRHSCFLGLTLCLRPVFVAIYFAAKKILSNGMRIERGKALRTP